MSQVGNTPTNHLTIKKSRVDIRMTLYDYQLKALRKMSNGCILNGTVGSGKSLTSIAYYYLENGGSQSSLVGGDMIPMLKPQDLYIITTAHKRDLKEWEGELLHFTMSTNKDVNFYNNTIVVDSWNNISKYENVKESFFIFDEQRVVGKGAWVKAFLKIAKSNRWILLSATPGDTWSDYIPVFIANGFYKNRTEFNQEHIVWSRYTKYPKVDRYLNTGRLIRLRDKILVDMDFHRETEPHHEDIYVRYDTTSYKEAIRTRWDTFNDKPVESAGELCYLLRRIVNTDISRQIALLEILEDHPKAIIFYNFDYELDILKQMFENDIAGTYEVAEWNGHKHQPLPTSNQWVYLVQYNAGNEGWNCITTDTMIFFSQNYSYKVMVQASGRIDRLNTPFKHLYYYHLKSRSGIDLAIGKALGEKKKFNETKFAGKWLSSQTT